jgi:GNAT superfamily N-acetyltransferase
MEEAVAPCSLAGASPYGGKEVRVRIVDVDETTRPVFCQCLEDWPDDVREAGDRRCRWVERFAARGLRARLALDDAGIPGGMIQYLPIEESTVDGEGLYFIPCIWVHGHRTGRGDFQGHGMGRALLAAAEEDARALRAKGMAAWGLWLPFWMRASWFKRHGYRAVDRDGIASLLFKPFAADARPPRFFRRTVKPLDLTPDRVNVTSFVNGWCTAGNVTAERARRVASEFGEAVVFREVDTSEHSAVAEWGLADALFVDGKQVMTGPPISPERLRKIVRKRVARSSGRP